MKMLLHCCGAVWAVWAFTACSLVLYIFKRTQQDCIENAPGVTWVLKCHSENSMSQGHPFVYIFLLPLNRSRFNFWQASHSLMANNELFTYFSILESWPLMNKLNNKCDRSSGNQLYLIHHLMFYMSAFALYIPGILLDFLSWLVYIFAIFHTSLSHR